MTTITVSSKMQIVLPADIRRRLGLMAGSQMEIIEEPDGVRLVVSRPVTVTSVAACAGMVTAPSTGKARNLVAFDPASLLKKMNAVEIPKA
jgi:AbrB family looped-hinge helix DNA binding protein